MLPEFLSATSAIKSSLEIIKAIQEIKDTSQIQQKTIELNSIILDLQNSLFSLRDAHADITNRHAELEKKCETSASKKLNLSVMFCTNCQWVALCIATNQRETTTLPRTTFAQTA